MAQGKLEYWLTQRSDLLLAFAVVLIIATLIMPMQPWMLDILIGANITIAATMTLVALYLPSAARIPSFPTILLLTTLFRLALNVSSTRLILLEADAGKIIYAFGDFVVQGNYIVGAVVFLILVLIQFIVIAKGSERVAEVAARFTLDAMPGKQMSIDADLRNGIITPELARDKRKALEKESQLYGAMDGAMKFVKGDAIAGIVISLINIIGGLTIGVWQQGMELSEAAQVYSLLTIGDGLVSQIPALLLSTSAGLVVTRVASEMADEQAPAGVAADLVNQIVRYPRAIASVAVLLFGMAFLPGFPAPVFIAFGTFMGVLAMPRLMSPAVELAPGGRVRPGAGLASQGDGETEVETEDPRELLPPHPTPVILELHASLTSLLVPEDPGERAAVTRTMQAMGKNLYADMGLHYPPVTLKIDCPYLPDDGYSVLVFECPVANCTFPPDHALLFCTPPDARGRGIEATPVKLPWGRTQACMAPAEAMKRAREGGIRALTARDVVLQHLMMTLRRHSADFLGIQESRFLLDHLESQRPALVQEVIPRHLSMEQVTCVLKRLLAEEVPIRDLRQIVESLAHWGQTQKDPLHLTELVRRDLRRTLCTRYAIGRRTLQVYLLDPGAEQMIAESVTQTETGMVVALAPEAMQDFLAAVGGQIRAGSNLAQNPVILTTGTVRRFVRTVVETEYPEVVVLSYDELIPQVNVRAIGRISMTSEPVG